MTKHVYLKEFMKMWREVLLSKAIAEDFPDADKGKDM